MRICFDIDGTICESIGEGKWYDAVEPLSGAVESLKKLKADGHYIILQTARHMKTCNGNEGKVLVLGAKLLFDWLAKWEIPYDEVYFGKPHADLFIDDKGRQHIDWDDTNKTLREFYQATLIYDNFR
jgi:capsule biosynthesis phosphatase